MQIDTLLINKGYYLEGKIYVKNTQDRCQYVEVINNLIRCYSYIKGELEYYYTIDVTSKDQLQVFLNQK